MGGAARLCWRKVPCTTSVAPASARPWRSEVSSFRRGSTTTTTRAQSHDTTSPTPLSPIHTPHLPGYAHGTHQPQWFTRSCSGAASVTLPASPRTARHDANSCCSAQVSPHDCGSSALRCARSSTRNLSGSTPSTPASAAALATGSWAWSTGSSGFWPTDETNCSRSGHGGRSAKTL